MSEKSPSASEIFPYQCPDTGVVRWVLQKIFSGKRFAFDLRPKSSDSAIKGSDCRVYAVSWLDSLPEEKKIHWVNSENGRQWIQADGSQREIIQSYADEILGNPQDAEGSSNKEDLLDEFVRKMSVAHSEEFRQNPELSELISGEHMADEQDADRQRQR